MALVEHRTRTFLNEAHLTRLDWPAAAAKRTFDLTFSAAGLVVLSPLFLVIAALISLDGGPSFFRQTRLGEGGRRFECLKFRTMRAYSEARLDALLARDPLARMEWERTQKLARDPRVTPVGRVLRRLRIDELPQLWNVLKGEMSLVGPRPIIAPEVAGYPNDRDYFLSRDFALYAMARPGVTGLWQVLGGSSRPYSARRRLDRRYVRRWSPALDARILLRTAGLLLKGGGV